MEEIYKDIPGYENMYQVSNFGNVKSLKFGKERLLKAAINSRGYYNVILSINNKRFTYLIHQLIAMSFLNHEPNGFKIVVDHIDNNKLNNRLDNLQLITTRHNSSKDKINTSSKYTGVSWHKRDNKWQTNIIINYKHIYLASFDDEKMASDMYQKALANIHLYNGNNKAFRLSLTNISL